MPESILELSEGNLDRGAFPYDVEKANDVGTLEFIPDVDEVED